MQMKWLIPVVVLTVACRSEEPRTEREIAEAAAPAREGTAARAASEASLTPQAERHLQRALEATGGRQAWLALEGLQLDLEARWPSGDSVQVTRTVDLYLLPDELVRRVQRPGGVQGFIAIQPRGVFMNTAQSPMPSEAPPETARELRGWQQRDIAVLMSNLARGRVGARYLGRAGQGDQFDALEVQPPQGLPAFRLYIDSAGLPAGRAYTQRGVEIEEILGDYRDVAGVRIPTRTLVLRGGEPVEDIRVVDITANPEIPKMDAVPEGAAQAPPR